MSDSISGRITRGRTRRVAFDFEGKLTPAEWDDLIRRIQTMLQRDFGDKAKLVEVED